MAWLAWRLIRKGHPLAPDREFFAALRLDGAILGKVLRIGLPTGVQMIVLSLSELVILALVNQHGSQATAAYGAVTQIVNYVQFPALSIAITASILGAQAIGAGRLERMGPILRTGLLINVCLTGGLIVLGYLLSHWLLGLFLTEDSTRAMAEHLLHIMLWSLLVFGFQAIIGGIMRASGTVLVPVVDRDRLRGRCAVAGGVLAGRAVWFAGRVDGVSGGVSGHAGVADAVLQTGLAASEDRTPGLNKPNAEAAQGRGWRNRPMFA